MTNARHYKAKHHKHIKGSTINKLCALAGIIAGLVSVVVLDDATALVFGLIFAVPLFFNKGGVYY